MGQTKTSQCQTDSVSLIFSLASSGKDAAHALYGSGKLDAIIAISSLTNGFCSEEKYKSSIMQLDHGKTCFHTRLQLLLGNHCQRNIHDTCKVSDEERMSKTGQMKEAL